MMKKIRQMLVASSIATIGLGFGMASPAAAADLPVFNTNYPVPNSACATFGDLVSCSTKVLDYLATQYPAQFTGPYGFSTAQGQLLDTIVIGVNGGNIADNGDMVSPSDDAFATQNGGMRYFYTGEANKNGGTNDPSNNGSLTADTPYSWDIDLAALIGKLTFNNAFHQLLIGFDMNENQNSTNPSIPIWSLVTIRDTDGGNSNVYFETHAIDPNNPFKSVSAFTSTKVFDGNAVTTPNSTDFAMTVGNICVVNDLVSYPSPDGSSCPSGGTLINTIRSSSGLEFINYFPELDLNYLKGQGYDTISVQVWMGCFGGGGAKDGPALADGIAVTQCDTGGFGDIFLLAGGEEHKTPEPGSLLLAGLGLLGLSRMRRCMDR